MDSTDGNSDASSFARLNYFNYFTEIEEEFVRRRGKPLLISPMDWALVESWKSAGIPLHVVVRAINQAFDSYDSRPRRTRKVNSIFYCQQEVETVFAEYRLSQVGAPPGSAATPQASEAAASESKSREAKAAQPPAFPREMLLEFLTRCDNELADSEQAASGSGLRPIADGVSRARLRLKELIQHVSASSRIDSEGLEHDLDSIDRMLLASIVSSTSEGDLKSVMEQAESELQAYRKKMDKDIYQQTVNNLVSRRLRAINRVPRLSLFYI
ncbi:MAG TPA: hypothetical protein VNH22_17215 [Blastocatellia bacterium]|nr:hypothetical protein [Blastocatellia bacterium]